MSEVFCCLHGSAGDELAAPNGAAGLPCLSSNNCTEDHQGSVNKLTGGHKRTAFVLAVEIERMASKFGVENLGFLTLTFADHVRDMKEASRRFHSLNSHVLQARYKRAIGVWERQKSGRLHIHLVVVLGADIRTGFNFAAVKTGDYASAGVALRNEWAFWRATAPKYRFGRTELLPVKSSAQGIARYVGGYVKKHIGERVEADKGRRLVTFIGFSQRDKEGRKCSSRCASSRFSWVSDNSWLWRRKLAAYAAKHGFEDVDKVKKIFGSRWAWLLAPAIMVMPINEVFPSLECAEYSSKLVADHEVMLSSVKPVSGGRDYVLRSGSGTGNS